MLKSYRCGRACVLHSRQKRVILHPHIVASRTSGRASLVAMMESADFGEDDHASVSRRGHTPGCGRVLLQREVRSRPVIIGDVTDQDSPQVPFADHDHVVQTFAPD